MVLQVFNPQASFTRPNDTTAYATNDLIANSTTAGSVVPLSIPLNNGASQHGITRITRIRLSKSGTTATNANFRVHFYQSSPTAANGDNGAWSTSGAADYLGSIDVASMNAFTDGCTGVGSASAGSEMFLRTTTTTIFALLMALAAYTPVAQEVFTLTVEDVGQW